MQGCVEDTAEFFSVVCFIGVNGCVGWQCPGSKLGASGRQADNGLEWLTKQAQNENTFFPFRPAAGDSVLALALKY